MTTDTFLTKRHALYKGEVGLFPEDEMAEEDIRLATMNAQLICRWYSPQTLKKQRFLWGLVYKAWQNSDIWLNHHAAMKDLKKRVHFTRMLRPDGELKEVVNSMTRIDDETLRLLTERIGDVICTEILPGMDYNQLRREVEEMLGVSSK